MRQLDVESGGILVMIRAWVFIRFYIVLYSITCIAVLTRACLGRWEGPAGGRGKGANLECTLKLC